MKSIAIIFFIFFVFSFLYPDDIKKPEFEFKQLSIIDGLSQNTVTSIYQDRYGYMWFGTEDGLNRYDGKDFRIYKHSHKDPNSIIASTIRVILESSDGELWITTANGGLSRFKREEDGFENFIYDPEDKNSLSGRDVFALFEDSKKNMWIGTLDGGLNKFDRKNKKFISYKFNPDDPKSISSNHVRAIYEDSSGVLWIGNNTGGLNRFNKTGSFDKFCYSKSGNENDDNIITIFQYQPGTLLIGTDGDGIKLFNTLTDKFDTGFPDTLPGYLKNGRIRSFYKDSSGILWITTFGDGIISVSKKKNGYSFVNYRNSIFRKESLSNNKVLDIYKNNENLLFFGTSGGGVNIIDTERSFFKNFRTDPLDKIGLNTRYVRSVFQHTDGTLLIGTDGDGLNIMTENSNYKLSDFGKNRIYSIFIDSYETIWIGTYGDGLYRSGSGTNQFVKYINYNDKSNTLSEEAIRVIYEGHDKSLWIGTQFGGINKFNRKDQSLINYRYDENNKKSISHNHIRAITEDIYENLWIATWEGLNRFDKKKKEFFRFVHDENNKNSLSHNHILSMLSDKNGIIWIGTWGGGLNRFDPENGIWNNFTEADGFPNNVIYGILEETNEKPDPILWMSTNHGLIRYDTKNINIKVYDSSSGIQSDEFNGGAFFQNKNGEMYFGGINGLTKFDPSEIKDNPYTPKVQISGIKVFNEYRRFSVPVEDIKEIELSFDENYFMIEFILLSYRSSNRNTYKYKLDGFDSEWINSGKRNNAGYTNLEGGNYTFLVKGANNDGIWSNEITKLRIRIIPPLWETVWFKTLIILIFLFISLFFYKLRTTSLKKEKAQLEKANLNLNKEISERINAEEEKEKLQEKLIQSEKMEILGTLAGGVAHDLNNILGAIVSYPDLLLMKLPEDSPLRKPVLTIQQSGKKAAAVVKDLLTLARRGVKEQKVINLNNIIVELFKSPEFESIKKDNPEINFNLSLDENLYNISGSEIHISKSLINLILNSVEAIKTNGQIFISTTNIIIKEKLNIIDSSLNVGEYVVFRIIDDGEGIAEGDIKRIFEPFYTKKKMGRSGTGLGMAVIAGMVKDHRGEIDVWSSTGVGTSIDIYLPATTEKIKSIGASDLINEYLGNKEKILIIDDAHIQREIATLLLEQLNYTVNTASSGEDGLNYLDNNEADIVLLDMIMDPGIDGLTTYKRIVEMNKEQKVIIVSGFSNPERVEEAKALGVDSYIGKPYTIDVLGKIIKQVLTKENK